MPYITQDRRQALATWLGIAPEGRCKDAGPLNAGELNFCLTALIIRGTVKSQDFKDVFHAYIDSEPLRYQRINDVVGAAECAALEADARAPGSYKFPKAILVAAARDFYRSVARPYEDAKIKENGDIDYNVFKGA